MTSEGIFKNYYSYYYFYKKNFIHKFFAGFGFFRKDQVSVVTSIIALKDLDVANALGV